MKHILVLIEWFCHTNKVDDTIIACRNLISCLSHQYCFYIFTVNSSNKGIVYDQWIAQGDNSFIWYASKKSLTSDLIKQIIMDVNPHTIYLNCIFSLHFSLLPLFVLNKIKYAGKIVIAPPGMLKNDIIECSTFKKKAFAFLLRHISRRPNVFFQATSLKEAYRLKKYVGNKCRVLVVENVPNTDHTLFDKKSKEKGTIKCVFVSAMQPGENLLFALEVLQAVDERYHVQFDIFGSIGDRKYVIKCLEATANLPEHIKVNFCKPIPDARFMQKLGEYHLLFLPTQGENCGHINVAIEAMSSGCIALTSDQTPWHDVETFNAGWALSLNDPLHFVEKIQMVCDMDSETFDQMAVNARGYAHTYYRQLNFAKKYEALFE